MEIQITTLSENSASFGGEFLAEWGLSMFIQVEGQNILMDTGRSISAVHNAHVLGVDLSTIDKIVLSHGHVDHTGGLREVLLLKGEVDVIAHPDIWAAKYSRREHNAPRYSGIPHSRLLLESLGAKFHLEREPVHLSDRIMTTGEIPMATDYEKIEPRALVREDSGFKPDPLADDLSLVIDTEFGLVVILGCAHRGIVNILRHAQNLTGKELIYAAIGGIHLFRAPEEQVEKTIAELKEMGIQRLGVSHCTGFRASARLAQEFGDMFFLNNAGTRFTLP